MKIVILGASGQIGNILFEAMRKIYEVTGTSRYSSSQLLQFDPFNDNWSMLGRPDVIVNCIGLIKPSRTFTFSKIHLGLTKQLIENRTVLGEPRIIQMSALGASTRHTVEFLRTKGEADAYLLKSPDVVVVRPSIVCTHRTMMVEKMLMLFKLSRWMKGLVIVPEGFPQRRIQPVMPEDLAAIVSRLCSTPEIPKTINVAGPTPLTFLEVISIMFEARKKDFKLVTVPKLWTDIVVKYGVGIVLPHLINAQQYELLFNDNVADPGDAQKYLGSRMNETKQFWNNEFRDYGGH